MNILFYDNGKIHRKLSGSDYTEPDYRDPDEPSQRLFYHASPPAGDEVCPLAPEWASPRNAGGLKLCIPLPQCKIILTSQLLMDIKSIWLKLIFLREL